jgi:hypothetical protein
MQANNNSTETPSPSGISRRTVVAGVAWAVPAITVAGTLPAMAASECITFSFSTGSCKDPGTPFGYKLIICVASTCPGSVFPLHVTGIETGSNRYLTTGEYGQSPPEETSPRVTADFTESSQCVLVNGYAQSSANNLTIYYRQQNGTLGSFNVTAPPDCSTVTTTSTTAAVTTTTTTAR